jgi:hypothetical protein
MTLTATYISGHTHVPVGGDKTLVRATRSRAACVVDLCRRVLLLFLHAVGVKMLLQAPQATVLIAVIFFAAAHEVFSVKRTVMCVKLCTCS